MISKLLCFIFGHEWFISHDPDGDLDMYVINPTCTRCGETNPYIGKE